MDKMEIFVKVGRLRVRRVYANNFSKTNVCFFVWCIYENNNKKRIKIAYYLPEESTCAILTLLL